MKKSYELWQGQKVRNINTNEIYISTTDAQWQFRLAEWKRQHLNDPNCPCPMPAGHIMFRNAKRRPDSSYYKSID